MRVELHPKASAELAAQVDYYEHREPGVGERFYREVMGMLRWIADNPEIPRWRRNHRRVNLRIFPFYIAYVVDGDLIRVLAIADGRRRPGYWFERLSS